MTKIEKILNVLKINENVSSIVVDQLFNIQVASKAWNDNNGTVERGENFLKLFDKNTSLLIKSSFLDAKTFLKIQRREVLFKVEDKAESYNLILSPFKVEEELFFYILLTPTTTIDDLLIYPSLDDNTISSKYERIIDELNTSFPKTEAERKNFQFNIDIEKEPIVVLRKTKVLFINNSYNTLNASNLLTTDELKLENIFPEELLLKFRLVESEVINTKSLFVIEHLIFDPNILNQKNRIILYPILNNLDEVDKIILFGNIDTDDKANSDTNHIDEKNNSKNANFSIDHPSEARIVYDRNSFEILDANRAAANIYGYDVNELKQINITELYPPEEMQKLLEPITRKSEFILHQVTKNEKVISVKLQRARLVWNGNDACMVIIEKIEDDEVIDKAENEVKDIHEEDVQEGDDIKKEKDDSNNNYDDTLEKSNKGNPVGTTSENKNLKEDTQIEKPVIEKKSEFLSSLFHELLTPVNVILGFVQEIVDSIDHPTEEQEESAQIIKDNQKLLLQTMNTAVQYAQLEENKLKFNIEKFDLNNSLVDLQDSFSKISEKENVKVIFDNLPESVILNNDRPKLLAAISYFIKFIIKLTKSPEVFVSYKIVDNNFYLLAKDSENEVSENVASEMLEIFNGNSLNGKKDYGISPITINLAKKLNELLSAKVIEYNDPNEAKHISLVTPLTLNEQIIVEQDKLVDERGELTEDIKVEHTEKIIEESEVPKEIFYETNEHVPNGEIDDKIVEDIHEEEEIITEEIATVEEVNIKTLDLSNLSCLFIDDIVDSQLLFRSQMKDFKFLKVCSSLTEALPLLKKYNFDIIFVDINLNDKYNGLDALKIIRQFNNYKTTPLVAVTAYPFEGDREQFLNFGFTDYFIKPLLREKLVKSLEQILV